VALEFVRSRKIRGTKITLTLDQEFCRACGDFRGVETMLRQLRDELGYKTGEFVTPSGVHVIDLTTLP
jgi:hypothetical protein